MELLVFILCVTSIVSCIIAKIGGRKKLSTFFFCMIIVCLGVFVMLFSLPMKYVSSSTQRINHAITINNKREIIVEQPLNLKIKTFMPFPASTRFRVVYEVSIPDGYVLVKKEN